MRQLTISPAIPQASHALERYLSELSDIPLITAEEEIRLARRIRAGDEAALEQLVRANLRFVVSVAKQYQNPYIPLMDLISEGNIGLVMAAERFDETKGFKFISYAVWWIRKLILEAIAEQGRLVRLPASKIREILQLQETIQHLTQQLDRQPTEEELADHLGLTTKNIRELWTLQARRTSLDAPLETDEDLSWLEILANQNAPSPDTRLVKDDTQRMEIDEMLSTLPHREAHILRLNFGVYYSEDNTGDQAANLYEYPLEDIGREVGLCKERVRVLKNRTLLKLRMRFSKV